MSLWQDQPRAGRVVFLCPQPALNLALGEAGTWCRRSCPATILPLAQGRSAWEGRQSDVTARAIPAAFPRPLSFSGLPEAERSADCMLGCPKCYFFLGVEGHPSLLDQKHLHLTREDSLAKAVAGGQLLASSQQLIFRSQCVSVTPEVRRPPRTDRGWDVPLSNCEKAKSSPGMCSGPA